MPDDTLRPSSVFDILQKADLAKRLLESRAVDVGPKAPEKPGSEGLHADHDRLVRMEALILQKLNDLGGIGVDNWISRSHPVASEIRAWLRLYEHLFPEEEQEVYERMLLYQQALQQGVTCVRKIEMRKELIKDEVQFIRSARSQVEGSDLSAVLANLPEVASTLAMLHVRIRRRHDQMLTLDELTPLAEIFTAILEWTGGILSQLAAAQEELGATQHALELERMEQSSRKQMDTVGAQIRVSQSSLVGKMLPSAWILEAGRLEGFISEWLELNERLREPMSEDDHMATFLLITEQHAPVLSVGACSDRFMALRGALAELPPDNDDINKIQRLQARLASIEGSIGGLVSHLSVAIRGYSGPNLFQGLRSWLGAIDDSFPVFWTMLDKRKREAQRRARARMVASQWRVYLVDEYVRLRKRFADALRETAAPAEWMWLRGLLEALLAAPHQHDRPRRGPPRCGVRRPRGPHRVARRGAPPARVLALQSRGL